MVLHYNSTMSTPLQVTITRDGKGVGTYELAEVIRLLGAGTLKPTDLYWHEGMVGWELVSKLDTSEGLKLPVEPEVNRKSKNEFFGCGCSGLIFLIYGFCSVYLYNYSLGHDKSVYNYSIGGDTSGKAFSEAGAYCCGAISLIFLCFFIFRKK